MTQMTEARNGNITPEIQAVADYERIDVNKVLRGVANGAIVIPKNVGRDTKASGKKLTAKAIQEKLAAANEEIAAMVKSRIEATIEEYDK